MCYCSLLKGQIDSTKIGSIIPTMYSTHTQNDTLSPIIRDSLKANESSLVGKKLNINQISNVNNTDTSSFRLNNSVLKSSSFNKPTIIEKAKQLIPAGAISFGYDYGFLPYTTNVVSPASAFKSEGQLSMNILNIPLDITYFYTSQKNLIGLNNYFRISYDADRYKESLNSKLRGNIDTYQNQLGELNTEKQNLLQKMAYSDYLSSTSVDKWPLDTAVNSVNPIHTLKLPDSTEIKSGYTTDTTYKSKKDSSLSKADYYKYRSDSVKSAYNDYKEKYNLINDSIKKTQRTIDQMKTVVNGDQSAYSGNIPYFNKIQNFLSGVKRVEIGLCYPNHSVFLANNIPVRGINIEYGKNDVYVALTYGTTVSTLLYSPKNMNGLLQNVRNSYNYFDFSNVSEGRKILAVKFGTGTKEGNHVFVGFMIGKGQSSYFNPTNEIPFFIGKESNVVLEADMKYKLAKNTIAELVIGKSSLKDQDMSYNVINSCIKEIFSNYRSNALLAKINTKIPVTKTILGFSIRYIDPFFKSFGVGFMRSDNLRYEIKLDQSITNKLRYTGMFRYEEDNLLQLMNYKNRFYSVNNTLSYKIKRGLMARLSYTPLLRTLTSKDYNISNNNSISTAVVTFTPKTRKTSFEFNVLYSYYIVNTDLQQINFQNMAYNHQIRFKGGFKTGLNVSWFKNTLSDSLNNNIFFAMLDAGYAFKNGSSITVAGKSAYKLDGEFYPGFMAKINLKLYKSLFWENQLEKYIVGDLFNGYDLENLKRFPYCFSTRLIFNF